MTAIDTTDLTKRYDGTLAVDNLTVSIPEGTVYGFLGPNGAGKTTTMRMLTGLTRPTSGSGAVADVPITDRDGLRTHIGYLPEEPPLYEQATAYEQLEYVAGLRDLSDELTRNRIDTLLEELDLAADATYDCPHCDRYPRSDWTYLRESYTLRSTGSSVVTAW